MLSIVKKLAPLVPDIQFVAGDTFLWSPVNQTITYSTSPNKTKVSAWSLLHETGHALLGHNDYKSDLDLLLMEVAAWEEAKTLARKLDITIDEDHIQDCLDTYRDWLHQRSTCPRCGLVCLQVSGSEYRCHNCSCVWKVSSSRFCRPYRLTTTTKHGSKPQKISSFK